MTRTYADDPIWTWRCDQCGRGSGDLAFTQNSLPSPDAMRERGWHIADLFGDLCPVCLKDVDPAAMTTTTPAPTPAHPSEETDRG